MNEFYLKLGLEQNKYGRKVSSLRRRIDTYLIYVFWLTVIFLWPQIIVLKLKASKKDFAYDVYSVFW